MHALVVKVAPLPLHSMLVIPTAECRRPCFVGQRREVAEGMLSPAFPLDPDDSEASDGCYMSDFYSDDEVDHAGGDEDADGVGGMVPPWSELETAVQALMGMEQVDFQEDTWDATEPAR